MKKYIIIAALLSGLAVSGQRKPSSKAISPQSNTGAANPRVLDRAIKEYPFYFKGFAIEIHDDATDELGNHMLVGRIKALEKDESKRDPIISKVIDFSVGFYDKRGIMISTDKNYKIVKIGPSLSTEVIRYNPKIKKFVLGGNTYDLRELDGRSIGEWQPKITVVNLEQKGAAYTIKNDYSCSLKDFILDEDRIHVLAASEGAGTAMIKDQKLEIITVDLNRYHADKEEYLPEILDQVSKIAPPYADVGRMEVSGISKVGAAHFFATSNLDRINLVNKSHVYKFGGKTIEDQEDFSFLSRMIHHNPDLVLLKDFYTDPLGGYIFLTHAMMSGEIHLTKTNARFGVKKDIKINLYDYVDTSKMVMLSDGTIVVLSQNEDKLWEYSVYNSDLMLIKKINSGLAGNYHPQKLKVADKGGVESFFYDIKKIENNSVVQHVTVN